MPRAEVAVGLAGNTQHRPPESCSFPACRRNRQDGVGRCAAIFSQQSERDFLLSPRHLRGSAREAGLRARNPVLCSEDSTVNTPIAKKTCTYVLTRAKSTDVRKGTYCSCSSSCCFRCCFCCGCCCGDTHFLVLVLMLFLLLLLFLLATYGASYLRADCTVSCMTTTIF